MRPQQVSCALEGVFEVSETIATAVRYGTIMSEIIEAPPVKGE